MGIWSWLFPPSDPLARARDLMAKGRYEAARKILFRCSAPEAEALYDACSKAVDEGERDRAKKRLASQGFHGWRVDVAHGSAKRKAELEKLVAEELERAGVDLALPDIDPDVFQAAVGRAQRRARGGGGRTPGAVRLVPIESAP